MPRKKYQPQKYTNRDAHPRIAKETLVTPGENQIPLPGKGFSIGRKGRIYALIAVLLTCIVYLGSLNNGFIPNWDDGGYIMEYEPVHSFSGEHLKTIWTTFYKGNYHPLTTMFYLTEYVLVQETPFLYHFNNLLFHALNVFLVFWLVSLLAGDKRWEVPFLVAVLFGIHPMHVESVAWISERKDVLYTFFFLVSLIFYFFYAFVGDGRQKRNYTISLAAFACSLLSKSAAVTLPVVLLLMDYYRYRKWSLKSLMEKLPFFLLSVGFGVAAILSQNEAGAIQDDIGELYSFGERLMLSCYSLTVYVGKLFAPVHLMCMYAYPDRINGMLPTIHYVAPGIILVLTAVVFWSVRKTRDVMFGGLFFLVTISLVLQILPVGGAIMAERYTYVPYIGLFFILARLYDKAIVAKKYLEVPLKALLIAAIIVYSYLAVVRIEDWEKGDKLFIDLIEKEPNLPFGYNNLGYFYYKWDQNNAASYKYYTLALKIDPNFYNSLSNRGVVLYNLGRYEEALADFNKALSIKQEKPDPWIGRANTFSTLKRFEEAIPDYNRYLAINPDDYNAYVWRGIAFYKTNHLNESQDDFRKALEIKPGAEEPHYWMGYIHYNAAMYDKAMDHFKQSLSLNANRTDLYNLLGLACYNLRQYQQAIAYFDRAIQLFPDQGVLYAQRSGSYLELKQYRQALADAQMSVQKGFNINPSYLVRLNNMVKQ